MPVSLKRHYDNDEVIENQGDLPSPSGGTITLEDGVAYRPSGFVTVDTPFDWTGNPVFLGRHGSIDGFIYTGGGTMLQGTGAFMAESCYFHSPGGTMFNLVADNTTEMLVQNCAFSDAANIGNIADLGLIDGYRVPTFKGNNFEDFDAGLDFDGDPDKIFFWGNPLRNISASNLTMFTLLGTSSCRIVDFADNYVKDVQSDTEVWRVESGAEPAEIFQYRGTLHDQSFVQGNAIVGPNAGPQEVGFWVSDAHPVRDSAVVGEIALDSQTAAGISSQDTYVPMPTPVSLGNETERMSNPSGSQLRYDGRKDVSVHVTSQITCFAPSNETVAAAILKNGTPEPTSEVQAEGQGSSAVALAPNGVEDLSAADDDIIEIGIKNLDSATDFDIKLFNASMLGA